MWASILRENRGRPAPAAQRERSRWLVRTATPRPRSRAASSSAIANRPVAPAGTADRDRQVAASLGLVRRQHGSQQVVEPVEEVRRLRPLEHEVADRRVVAGERA